MRERISLGSRQISNAPRFNPQEATTRNKSEECTYGRARRQEAILAWEGARPSCARIATRENRCRKRREGKVTGKKRSKADKQERFGQFKGVFGTALLHVFLLRSTFFSQTVSAPRTQFEKKGWSCEST